jgi:hypothetical protein
VLVKNLTIGCTSGLRLVRRWEGRFFYPTVMPCWLNNPRAICEYTRFIRFVKPCPKIILGRSVGIGGILKNPIKPSNFCRKSQGRLSPAPQSSQGFPPTETRGGRYRHKALGRVSGASLAVLSISVSSQGPKRCFSKGFGRTDQGNQLAIAGDADRFAARGAPDQFRKLLSCFVQTDHSHVSSLSSDDSHLRKECLPS